MQGYPGEDCRALVLMTVLSDSIINWLAESEPEANFSTNISAYTSAQKVVAYRYKHSVIHKSKNINEINDVTKKLSR